MSDFTEKYNTKLSDEDEFAFQDWAMTNNRTGDLADYDMRGWWKENGTQAENGHFTDKYKKPNHPTFSDELQYHGKDDQKGGKWGGTNEAPTFTPSETNLKNMTTEQLQNYFATVEPDVKLVLPKKTRRQKWYGGSPAPQ